MSKTNDTSRLGRELTSDELNLVSGGVLSACELSPVCVEGAIKDAVATWNQTLWGLGFQIGCPEYS